MNKHKSQSVRLHLTLPRSTFLLLTERAQATYPALSQSKARALLISGDLDWCCRVFKPINNRTSDDLRNRFEVALLRAVNKAVFSAKALGRTTYPTKHSE